MMILVIAAAAWSSPPATIDGRSRGAHRATLLAALSAPVRPTVGGTSRYCFADQITPARPRLVCRSRSEWRRLGLEPIVG